MTTINQLEQFQKRINDVINFLLLWRRKVNLTGCECLDTIPVNACRILADVLFGDLEEISWLCRMTICHRNIILSADNNRLSVEYPSDIGFTAYVDLADPTKICVPPLFVLDIQNKALVFNFDKRSSEYESLIRWAARNDWSFKPHEIMNNSSKSRQIELLIKQGKLFDNYGTILNDNKLEYLDNKINIQYHDF